jgi:hypothetical protein
VPIGRAQGGRKGIVGEGMEVWLKLLGVKKTTIKVMNKQS